MPIPIQTWILPRPRIPYYKGGFPLNFEKKFYKAMGSPSRVLHPFGGKAEYGIRLDLKEIACPDLIGDAHILPFKDNCFDLVLCDPPYNDALSNELYDTDEIKYKKFIKESVRVTKQGGLIAVYHWVWTPRPPGASYYQIIVILTRVWHRPRICCVFKKGKLKDWHQDSLFSLERKSFC